MFFYYFFEFNAAKNSSMSANLHSQKTILVIDNAEELLHVLERILGRFGYNVFVKNCPEGMSEFVQNTRIDLLLLDVRLRGANGRFICQELKSDPKTNYFPVVLTSSYPSSLINLNECAGHDFIEKPFSLDDLISKVNRVIAGKIKITDHSFG